MLVVSIREPRSSRREIFHQFSHKRDKILLYKYRSIYCTYNIYFILLHIIYCTFSKKSIVTDQISILENMVFLEPFSKIQIGYGLPAILSNYNWGINIILQKLAPNPYINWENHKIVLKLYNTVAGLRGGIPDSESKSIKSGSHQRSPIMHYLCSRTRHTRASRIIEKKSESIFLYHACTLYEFY